MPLLPQGPPCPTSAYDQAHGRSTDCALRLGPSGGRRPMKSEFAACSGRRSKSRSFWRVRLVSAAALALLFGLAPMRAQASAALLAGSAALIEDVVVGSRILADFGVLDGFG